MGEKRGAFLGKSNGLVALIVLVMSEYNKNKPQHLYTFSKHNLACIRCFKGVDGVSIRFQQYANHHQDIIYICLRVASSDYGRKDIKDQLVRAALPLTRNNNPTLHDLWSLAPLKGHSKCGNCVVCEFTIECKEFVFNYIRNELKMFTNCNTCNVVCAIFCPCNKIYVGQTTQKICLRISQHSCRIWCKTANAPLVEHFLQKGHSENDIRWTIINARKVPPRGGDIKRF